MGAVRGCEIPEDLHYNIENNVWVRREDDGTVAVGMTSYAANLAGEIVSYTPKKVGKSVKQDKSCATVESGKWVGPVKTPVGGEVTETNEAVAGNPGLINKDPYGDGWLVKIKPDDWDGESGDLKTGQDALAGFESKMEADGFGGC
ncbi:glycine cleavage system H protein [Thiohalospira halophila DSM 15071]|uniref:Glycine cleavage system H protein n=1 Tax=Thiohalospira halophila DSM 15071 TaxID=1123397 RepID=A0A1I1WA90_9GAMM|nr:glycine cleavage system protein GcvH [Thiohalospira halophila]SFD89950.1 glycine cleavage system H protein [Thiohalospira halophila DSM 15071]